MPRKDCPACMSNFSLCMCSLGKLITPRHCSVLTYEFVPLGATALDVRDVICIMNLKPPAFHSIRLAKTVLRSNI